MRETSPIGAPYVNENELFAMFEIFVLNLIFSFFFSLKRFP